MSDTDTAGDDDTTVRRVMKSPASAQLVKRIMGEGLEYDAKAGLWRRKRGANVERWDSVAKYRESLPASRRGSFDDAPIDRYSVRDALRSASTSGDEPVRQEVDGERSLGRGTRSLYITTTAPPEDKEAKEAESPAVALAPSFQ